MVHPTKPTKTSSRFCCLEVRTVGFLRGSFGWTSSRFLLLDFSKGSLRWYPSRFVRQKHCKFTVGTGTGPRVSSRTGRPSLLLAASSVNASVQECPLSRKHAAVAESHPQPSEAPFMSKLLRSTPVLVSQPCCNANGLPCGPRLLSATLKKSRDGN